MIDNIVHKQMPTKFYIKQLQESMQAICHDHKQQQHDEHLVLNFETCLKSAQQLKKQLAEQLFEEVGSSSYLLKLNEELKQVITEAMQLYHKYYPERATAATTAAVKKEKQQQKQESLQQDTNVTSSAVSVAPTTAPTEEQPKEITASETSVAADQADEDVKMPWEE